MLDHDGRDNEVIERVLLRPDKRTVYLHDDDTLVTVIRDLSLLTELVKLTQAKRFEVRAGSLEVQ